MRRQCRGADFVWQKQMFAWKRWLHCKAELLESRRPFKYWKGSGKTNRSCKATRGLFSAYVLISPCIFTLTFSFTSTMTSHLRRTTGREETDRSSVNYLMFTTLPPNFNLLKDQVQTGMLLQSFLNTSPTEHCFWLINAYGTIRYT